MESRISSGVIDRDAIGRVRRFLSFTLALDYGLAITTPDRLSKADWHLFARLSKSTIGLVEQVDPDIRLSLLDWPDGLTNDDLEKHIFAPAAELGLRPKQIAFRLMLFTKNDLYPYRGSPYLFADLYGMRILAAKLKLDRCEIFDRVLSPSHSFRSRMTPRFLPFCLTARYLDGLTKVAFVSS